MMMIAMAMGIFDVPRVRVAAAELGECVAKALLLLSLLPLWLLRHRINRRVNHPINRRANRRRRFRRRFRRRCQC